ncbi:MAG: hypothetical protein WCG81_07470 [Candidatus Angelobacter sp.]
MQDYWLGMALTLQFDPEMEQMLTEQAGRQGVAVEAFIQEILARQVGLQASEHKLSLEEFEAALDAMTIYSDKIPALPLEAFKRGVIYRNCE